MTPCTERDTAKCRPKMSDSEEEEAILLTAAAAVAMAGRQHWVHPLLKSRGKDSEFERIIKRLKEYPDKFYGYFHMPLLVYEVSTLTLHFCCY